MLSFNMTYKWTLGAACSSMTNDWQWNSQHGPALSTWQNWGRRGQASSQGGLIFSSLRIRGILFSFMTSANDQGWW